MIEYKKKMMWEYISTIRKLRMTGLEAYEHNDQKTAIICEQQCHAFFKKAMEFVGEDERYFISEVNDVLGYGVCNALLVYYYTVKGDCGDVF